MVSKPLDILKKGFVKLKILFKDKSQVLTEALDEEIFQSIMDAIEAHKNIDIDGRYDVDDGFAIEPQPT